MLFNQKKVDLEDMYFSTAYGFITLLPVHWENPNDSDGAILCMVSVVEILIDRTFSW